MMQRKVIVRLGWEICFIVGLVVAMSTLGVSGAKLSITGVEAPEMVSYDRFMTKAVANPPPSIGNRLAAQVQYAQPIRVTGPLGKVEDGRPLAPLAFAVADLNSDGHEDVITHLWTGPLNAPGFASPLLILLNDGAGGFVDGTMELIAGDIPKLFFVRQILIEDFNGDGQLDVFLSNHGLEIGKFEDFTGEQNRLLLSGPDGKLWNMSVQNLPQLSDFSHGSSAADIDKDGDIDLWVNNIGGGEAPGYLMLNDGSGAFSIVADIGISGLIGKEPIVGTNGRLPDVLTRSFSPFWTHFIDADNDGDADLYIGLIEHFDRSNVDRTGILLNDGTGRFTLSSAAAIPAPLIGGTGKVQDSVRADVNRDGLQDLLLYQSDPQTLEWHFIQLLISNGDGTFRDETTLRLPVQSKAKRGRGFPKFWFRDINGDGQNEILIFRFGQDFQPATDFIDSYLNMGNGVFTPLPDAFVNVRSDVVPVDANRDGWVDFVDAKFGFNQLGEAELFLTTALGPNDPS